MSTAPLPAYDRPYLSFVDQVQLLMDRGMEIGDPALAARHVERIGYYRLKSYWFPFRQVQAGADGAPDTLLETFRPGTQFSHGVDLYVFDKKLRLLLIDAIERIEVALRVDVAHTLGMRDAWAHRSVDYLDPKRSVKLESDGRTRHEHWLDQADRAESRAKADWVSQFRATFSSRLPVWIAVELWEFGTLSWLLEIAHPVDRFRVAQKYGLSDKQLVSWVKALAYVRNVCAHHGRLWNHPLVIQPMLPKGAIPRLNHLDNNVLSQTRVYAAAAICQFFLDVINPTSAWKVRLRSLWQQFPIIPGIMPQQAGFLQNWGSHQIWQ